MQEEFAALLFFFGIASTAAIGFAVAWWRTSRRLRRLEDRQLGLAHPEDDRSDRLERALDALAGQVDQLASGQEFLNRLIAGRGENLPRPPVAHDPGITPR